MQESKADDNSAADLPEEEPVSATAPLPKGGELGVQLWQRYGTSPGVISTRPLMRMINRMHHIGSGNRSFLSGVRQRWTSADQEYREPHLTYTWPSFSTHSALETSDSLRERPPLSHQAAVGKPPIQRRSEASSTGRSATGNRPSILKTQGESGVVQPQQAPSLQPRPATVTPDLRQAAHPLRTGPQAQAGSGSPMIQRKANGGSGVGQPQQAPSLQPVSTKPIRQESKLSEPPMQRRTATSSPGRSMTGNPPNIPKALARTGRAMIQRKANGGSGVVQPQPAPSGQPRPATVTPDLRQAAHPLRTGPQAQAGSGSPMIQRKANGGSGVGQPQQAPSLQPRSYVAASMSSSPQNTLAQSARNGLFSQSGSEAPSSLTGRQPVIPKSLVPVNPFFPQRKKEPVESVIQRKHMKAHRVEATHAPRPNEAFIYRKTSSTWPETVARNTTLPFTELNGLPPTAREALTSIPSALPFSPHPGPSGSSIGEEPNTIQSEGPDFEELMERMCQRLTRQLVVEQERRGRIP